MSKNINKIIIKKKNVKPRKKGNYNNNKDIVNLKNNNDNDLLYLDLSLYVCDCGGSFKRFGRRSLNQYVCIDCGLYVPYEKMYLYKKNGV